MTVTTKYTPKRILYELRRHPAILARMRDAIRDSIKDERERGFFILRDWTPTETVESDERNGLFLGSNRKALASYHTHLPYDEELAGNLGCSFTDIETMIRNKEQAMIIGGPFSMNGKRGYGIAVYTPNVDFYDFGRRLKRLGPMPFPVDSAYASGMSALQMEFLNRRRLLREVVASTTRRDLTAGMPTIVASY